MKLGYYPGCSLTGTAREYDKSIREVFPALGIELQEIDDWSCCGASSAHVTSKTLAIALPARNLALAEEQGLSELLVPCAACYNRLISAQAEMAKDDKVKAKIASVIDSSAGHKVKILNVAELLERIGLDTITRQKKVDLAELKVACYYGCLLVRPNDVTKFDDVEQPTSLERIVTALGAKPVDWHFKVECCGGAHSIAHKKIVIELSKKIIDNARENGADIIAVACPMCHSNLDMRQIAVKRVYHDHRPMPILYISELIGIALGLNRRKLGLNLHFTKVPANLAGAAK